MNKRSPVSHQPCLQALEHRLISHALDIYSAQSLPTYIPSQYFPCCVSIDQLSSLTPSKTSDLRNSRMTHPFLNFLINGAVYTFIFSSHLPTFERSFQHTVRASVPSCKRSKSRTKNCRAGNRTSFSALWITLSERPAWKNSCHALMISSWLLIGRLRINPGLSAFQC